MEACAEKAESTTEFSVGECQRIVIEVLKREKALTGEVLVVYCREAGQVPHDDRAFGPVFAGLSRQKIIKKIGYGPRHRGHGTAGAIVWALA